MKLFYVYFSARLNSTNELTGHNIYVCVKKIRSGYMKGAYLVASNFSDNNFEPSYHIEANDYRDAVKGYLVKILGNINCSLDCLIRSEITLK